jgi:hypothetical protein
MISGSGTSKAHDLLQHRHLSSRTDTTIIGQDPQKAFDRLIFPLFLLSLHWRRACRPQSLQHLARQRKGSHPQDISFPCTLLLPHDRDESEHLRMLGLVALGDVVSTVYERIRSVASLRVRALVSAKICGFKLGHSRNIADMTEISVNAHHRPTISA